MTPMTLLLSMPDSSGGEWIFILIPALIVFFIFKAGQWYARSRKNKEK